MSERIWTAILTAVILLGGATGEARAQEAAPPESREAARRVESFRPEVVRVEGLPFERVRLSVSVLDENGAPVRGLTRDDFTVREGGALQTIVEFGREADRGDRPLSAVFLVDRSGSIGRQISKWREACGSLLSALRPIDEVRVAAFTDEVTTLVPFTRDPRRLARAVESFRDTGGGTRLLPPWTRRWPICGIDPEGR